MSDVPTALTAALADRYAIERELGAGGMATVYLAEDLKHHRQVALKVLRQELAAALGAERFHREIQIAAKLQHPNILPLLDSGEAGGLLYYAMPYVEGQSLRERLAREGALPVPDTVRILRDVVDALTEAHSHGVVHRDIKPENILLRGRHALVTDFGVAKAVSEATGRQTLTTAGVALGTPAYMAPEQASADPHLDHRVDIYAVGAVAYELLTGRPVFMGTTPQMVLSAHVTEAPLAITKFREAVPRSLEALVMRCLAKQPADRWQSAEELLPQLEALATPSGGITPTDTQPLPAAPKRGLPATGWLAAAGVLVAMVIVWSVAGHGGRVPAPSPFLAAIPVQLTTSGRVIGGVPSPDGSLLAYSEEHCESGAACRGDLVIREVAGEGASTIVSQPGRYANPVAWSPDGRWVVFDDPYREKGIVGGLFIVSQRGGTPRRLAPGGPLPTAGFVAPDTLVLTATDGPHWLRRLVASTGAVVDSVLVPIGGYVGGVMPAPSGARLLVMHQSKLVFNPMTDSSTVSIVDRSGRVTDSIRIASLSSAAWAGGSDAVVLAEPVGRRVPEGRVGLVFVRRRIDTRGRFLAGTDTLRTLAEGAGILLGMSADGTQLFYQMTRGGEVGLWTATRANAGSPFARGRKIGSTTGSLEAAVSYRGGWVFLGEVIITPAGTRVRITVEPFARGESHVLEPGLLGMLTGAFAPGDDSLAVMTDAGSGRTALTVYPLPSGTPVQRGTFDGVLIDCEWLSDGRLATVVDSRRLIRIIGRKGEVTDIPVPDSLGSVWAAAPSPFTTAFAVATFAVRGERPVLIVHRVNPDDGRYTLVTRDSTFSTLSSHLWWTTDGFLHTPMAGPGDERVRLYRVPIGGGAFEAEPRIGFESNASVNSLSLDGRRAIVQVQSKNTDLWVLRAARQ
jgi:hypothetical protein